jgi:hypothetical protein
METKEEITEFKQGDYIVTLKGDFSITRCAKENYCFKIRFTANDLNPEIDLNGSTKNGNDNLKFNKSSEHLTDWRYATPQEIAEYDRLGKPFDVTTLKPTFEVGKWYKHEDGYYGKLMLKNGEHEYPNEFPCKEYISLKKEYHDTGTYFMLKEMLEGEVPLSEIQQYLPEGHPDKIVHPEYYECLIKILSTPPVKVGQIVKSAGIQSWYISGESGKTDSYSTKLAFEQSFKPSTKEAFDAQNNPELIDHEGITKGTKVKLISCYDHFSNCPGYIFNITFHKNELNNIITIDKIIKVGNEFAYQVQCADGTTFLRRRAFQLIKKETMEEIQEECKRRFPIGSTVKPFSNPIYTITQMDGYLYTIHGNTIWANDGKGHLYRDGQYAELIESPKEEEWIPKVGDWVTVFKVTSKGMDSNNILNKTFQITKPVTNKGAYGLYVTGYKEQFKHLFPLSEGGIYLCDLRKALPHEIPTEITSNDYQNVLDIQVGDIVQCISENKSRFCSDAGNGWQKDLIFLVTKVAEYGNHNVYFGGKNTNGVYSDSIKLVKRKDILPISPEPQIPTNFVLPKKWCVKSDKNTVKTIAEFWDKSLYLNKIYASQSNINYYQDYYWHSHNLASGTPLGKDGGSNHVDKQPQYTEITFEQFQKYVLEKEISTNPQKQTLNYHEKITRIHLNIKSEVLPSEEFVKVKIRTNNRIKI